jgi:hypothetical protein
MRTLGRPIKIVVAVALSAVLLLGAGAVAQTGSVAGGACSGEAERSTTSPFLYCKPTKVNGKTVFRWVNFRMPPPPRNVTGLRRCLWGRWLLTSDAFGAYWDSALAAMASVAKSGSEPRSEPGEITDALADPGPVVWAGSIGYVFNQGSLNANGTIRTEGYAATSDALMPFETVGSSQIKVNVPAGSGLFTVQLEGVGTVTSAPGEFEQLTMDVACGARSLTLSIRVAGAPPVKIGLVRPPV